MKKMLSRFAVIALLFFLLSGSSIAQFNITGEFRARGEYRDGYMALHDSSVNPCGDILGRARLLFDYNNEKISTRFSLYDAWVFGQNNYSSDTITKNTVNIYEAWFKYSFSRGFGLKLGRMELVYDDERFLGASNWSMWGATHDIVVAQWAVPGAAYKGDFGFAINNMAPATSYLNSYNIRNNYKYMAYLYENMKFLNDKLTISFLGLVDAFQKPSLTSSKTTTKNDTMWVVNQQDTIGMVIQPVKSTITTTKDFPTILYARFTVGADVWYKVKNWTFFLTGFYQGGHYKDGRKLTSNFYSANIIWQVVKPFGILVGYDHLGGNDFSDTTGFKTKVKGISTLYGTSHRGYGYMDMFNSLAKDNLSPGLNDLYLRATYQLNDKMSIEGTYRWFSIPHGYLPVKNPAKGQLPYTSVKKSLGSEVDLVYTYKPISNLEFSAAYCSFLPTSTMEQYSGLKVGTSQWAQYAYIMIAYKPNFFTSDKK